MGGRRTKGREIFLMALKADSTSSVTKGREFLIALKALEKHSQVSTLQKKGNGAHCNDFYDNGEGVA